MTTLSFFVPGVPAPQGSKRYLGQTATGKARMAESSARVAPWRADVRSAADVALENIRFDNYDYWDVPLAVTLSFRFPRPKRHYYTGRNVGILRDNAPDVYATKPDLDKLIRAVLDALTGIVWADDSRVTELTATKGYADQPGLHVLIGEAK